VPLIEDRVTGPFTTYRDRLGGASLWHGVKSAGDVDSPVQVWETVGRGASRPCNYFADADKPGVFTIKTTSVADAYCTGVFGPTHMGTSLLLPLDGVTLVLPVAYPTWESWLPEYDAAIAMARPSRTAIGRQITEIRRITALSDTQLASAFPGGLSRETIVRWRNGPNPNLRQENLHRLGILHELAQRLEFAGIDAPIWLHQQVQGEPGTPFELICQGRLGEVRTGVEMVAAGFALADGPMRVARVAVAHDIVMGDDETEGDWLWQESETTPSGE
jgi:hypothetical protein